MRVHVRCDQCGEKFWAKGYSDEDVGISAAVSEDDPMDDACECIRDGGSFTVIDSEYEEDD